MSEQPQVSLVDQLRAEHPNEVQAALAAMNLDWDSASDAQRAVAAYAAAGANGQSYMKTYHKHANLAEGFTIDPPQSIAERFAEENIGPREQAEFANWAYDPPRGESKMKYLQQELERFEKNRAKPPLGKDGTPMFDDPCQYKGKR